MKILLAADGSEYTRKAAAFLARHIGDLKGTPTVFVHHVRPPFPYPGAVPAATIAKYMQEEAKAALEVAGRELGAAGIAFTDGFSVGDIAGEIAAEAKRRGADIVIVGSHGHGALARLALGSVATRLVATLEVPVLVVP